MVEEDESFYFNDLDPEEDTPKDTRREQGNTEGLLSDEDIDTVTGSAYGQYFDQAETGTESCVVKIPDRPSVVIESYKEIPNDRGNVYSNYEDSEKIELTFPQPNISKDAGTNTVEHDVIGGKTIVQKLGEKATEIEIEGICTIDEADQIDRILKDDVIYLRSYRHEGYAVLDSTSTTPISNGGAIVGARNGCKFEWSHEFTINCKSIQKPKRI